MPGKGSYLVHVGMFRQLATVDRGAHNSRMETGQEWQEARNRTREKQEHERNGNRSGRDGNEGVRDTVTERKDMSCGTIAGTE